MPAARGTSKHAQKLTDEMREHIVMRLAMYDKNADIREWLLDEYGIVVTKEGVRHYDAGTGRKLAQRWVDLFNDTRAKFINDVNSEPIANRAWRLRRLSEDYERTRLVDPDTARKQLELAAKETAEYFRPAAKAKDAGTDDSAQDIERTTEEAANMLADRLTEAFARMAGGGVVKVKGSNAVQ